MVEGMYKGEYMQEVEVSGDEKVTLGVRPEEGSRECSNVALACER